MFSLILLKLFEVETSEKAYSFVEKPADALGTDPQTFGCIRQQW
jgi:hypothetical protein